MERASRTELPPGAAMRTVVAVVPLTVLWALAFTGRAPFYPTIVVGAVAMLAGAVWVRRTPIASAVTHGGGDTPAGGASPRGAPFPAFRVGPGQAGLAVAVAIAHYLVGLLLFAAASRLVPVFAQTAAVSYDRAAAMPLWGAVLIGGLVSAPLEEVFWRGAVQPVVAATVARRWPSTPYQPGLAIVIGAVVYAMFHAATTQLALVAAALLGGLVWGWLVHRTGSLGAAMIAHGLWTSLMLLLPPA